MFFKEIKYELYDKKLKNNIDILHISDIHYMKNSDNKLLDVLYNRFKKIKVNYIIITGDIIDYSEALKQKDNRKELKRWLIKMSQIAPLIISYGNHDIYIRVKKKFYVNFDKEFWDEIGKQKNIHIVDNGYYEDKNLSIYGYTPSIYYYYPKEKKELMLKELSNLNINNTKNNKFNICLIHSPMYLYEKDIINKLNNYDLILSGHMHNGLIPPLLDELFKNTIGIISRDLKLFPRMSRGYTNSTPITIISSGINKMHNHELFYLNWTNIFYPIGYNVISLKSNKCKFTSSYKYTK